MKFDVIQQFEKEIYRHDILFKKIIALEVILDVIYINIEIAFFESVDIDINSLFAIKMYQKV